ncbi:uncharacterized protein LY89DRAFT_211686 [Mollisia scopiformis]|uniref:Uncharacterized protein n=1 Tax=Mollisia scopiformis TaxID=149040 RepID=A0A194WYG0_MOLSC|nr:uncharacterized protein LY89DRAFT_211686 [Mollisia scopiformis]KUJ12647.1 hypothetical protein LY89DRAFT_211686 [Mollisia scopiformis]
MLDSLSTKCSLLEAEYGHGVAEMMVTADQRLITARSGWIDCVRLRDFSLKAVSSTLHEQWLGRSGGLHRPVFKLNLAGPPYQPLLDGLNGGGAKKHPDYVSRICNVMDSFQSCMSRDMHLFSLTCNMLNVLATDRLSTPLLQPIDLLQHGYRGPGPTRQK